MNIFEQYDPEDFYDELFSGQGQPRPHAAEFISQLSQMPMGELQSCQDAADIALRQMGITFTVYGQEEGIERVWPFDLIPRLLPESDWRVLERGLRQRIEALNLFIDDVYGAQRILKEKVIPSELVLGCKAYREVCRGLKPPRGIWCHITGTDLVRDRDGQFYVLEDNMRCPSGISYVLENRRILKQTFPGMFRGQSVRTVVDYPYRLREMLQFLAPESIENPTIAVLSPGIFNSAYFEHSFLASEMGVMLVEGRDLVVDGDYLFMRTTDGYRRVDVIYRRLDDDFLDPEVFRPDSILGVAGLMRVYAAGNVALANAPGTGIADDKAVYAYLPQIVKFYLDEDILLPNVPTHVCDDPKEAAYVIENLDKLVVKAVGESGGYGMLMGPQATATMIEEFRHKIKDHPRNFVAQPVLSLSRVPTLVDGKVEGRHVDLRPFILYGSSVYVHPGGLTRVALRKGSLVVNSSQGGGSKDTWVVTGNGGAH